MTNENQNPSNAVIVSKLESLKEAVLAHQITNKEEHQRLIEQTTRTNGRVTSLEKTKNMTIGALVFMNIIIVPIAIALILKWINA